jgi:hypothetical protein
MTEPSYARSAQPAILVLTAPVLIPSAVPAKRERLSSRGSSQGFVGTVSEATGLIGQCQDAGMDLLIHNDGLHDVETREPFVSDLMPYFA